jgi:4-amino-4-deoxy-L-arabinose transferase-like glycosyltransferase
MLSRMGFSWETRSAAPPTTSAAPVTTLSGSAGTARARERARSLTARMPHPELAAVLVLAGVLNLWSLSRNGWANTYYAAAVRSMSSSWHDFLFASLDKGGVMTVDKPPLALWIQALSVRIFGFHSLSILVPQALMGVAGVALMYDLVRRRFGRVGGFVAALALAVTPITVAISRHNNPDSLLVLCCVAALWCTVRGLEAKPAGRSTRWLAAAGVAVGLGFETKMLVALVVVPGIVVAWLWLTPAGRGRLHALRQLLTGGATMVIVGGAWPALVELTPAADRPWISGTANNTIFSLIFEYNGLGRVDGQAGGPGGTASNTFGGSPGPLRLLNSALGGQGSWLLGFALVSGLGILVASRLRRADTRTGWLMVVGGAFLTTAVLFSSASGIFHPYYVSLLAPFIAALVGAGAAELLGGRLHARIVAPLAVIAGVVVELVVRGDYPGQLSWLAPLLMVVGALAIIALVAFADKRVRIVALAAVLSALLIAPTVWAFDTLGYATSSTFPAGGPADLEAGGGGFGGSPFGGAFARRGAGGGLGSAQQLFGNGSSASSRAGAGGGGAGGEGATPQGGFTPPGAGRGAGGPGAVGGAAGGFPGGGSAGGLPGGAGVAGGAPGGGGAFGVGGSSLKSVLSYISSHGGGTLAVSSQSTAASAILEDDDANVAGIGGFSGRESDVSVSWLAGEVSKGKISWVLDEEAGGTTRTGASAGGGLGGFGGRGLPGDNRTGAKTAMAAVAKACERVTLPSSTTTGSSTTGAKSTRTSVTSATTGTLYDCEGRASELAGA